MIHQDLGRRLPRPRVRPKLLRRMQLCNNGLLLCFTGCQASFKAPFTPRQDGVQVALPFLFQPIMPATNLHLLQLCSCKQLKALRQRTYRVAKALLSVSRTLRHRSCLLRQQWKALWPCATQKQHLRLR